MRYIFQLERSRRLAWTQMVSLLRWDWTIIHRSNWEEERLRVLQAPPTHPHPPPSSSLSSPLHCSLLFHLFKFAVSLSFSLQCLYFGLFRFSFFFFSWSPPILPLSLLPHFLPMWSNKRGREAYLGTHRDAWPYIWVWTSGQAHF